MLARLSAFDRGRYAEPAALACCLLLGALTLWLAVRLVWALVPRSDAALTAAPVRLGADSAATAAGQSVANWHLFGNAQAMQGMGTAASALSLILRGTLAAANPHTGIAVIADPRDGERAYSVGDEVASGITLSAVYPDRVTLSRAGSDETLLLPRDHNLDPANIVQPTPATATSHASANPITGGAAASARNGASASTQTVRAPTDWQQTVASLRQNPAAFMKRVQVVPVLQGGKLAGVRLSAGGDAALLKQIGLAPGDVVTAVNGQPIDSFARGEEIMSDLGNARSVQVTVLRDGKTIPLTVGLQ